MNFLSNTVRGNKLWKTEQIVVWRKMVGFWSIVIELKTQQQQQKQLNCHFSKPIIWEWPVTRGTSQDVNIIDSDGAERSS